MAVTMREVAASAGVSIKTVSNVINDYPYVKPDTRARVLQAIDELGYRPNLSARSLGRGHTGLIALALPELDAPYFAELARLVISAQAQSWTVLIEQPDGLRAHELMAVQGIRNHLVDGVILSPLALGPRDLSEAVGEEPVVLLGERVSDVQFDHVAIDNVTAAQEAVAHLAGNGRRRIAAIGAQDRESAQTAHLRMSGYPQSADRWTWLVIAAHTQPRLARELATDLRRPWERPAATGRLSPARVRRGFRHLRQKLTPARQRTKPTRPGPGRPPGSKNRRGLCPPSSRVRTAGTRVSGSCRRPRSHAAALALAPTAWAPGR